MHHRINNTQLNENVLDTYISYIQNTRSNGNYDT